MENGRRGWALWETARARRAAPCAGAGRPGLRHSKRIGATGSILIFRGFAMAHIYVQGEFLRRRTGRQKLHRGCGGVRHWQAIANKSEGGGKVPRLPKMNLSIRQIGTSNECRSRWLRAPATTSVITHSPSRSSHRGGVWSVLARKRSPPLASIFVTKVRVLEGRHWLLHFMPRSWATGPARA